MDWDGERDLTADEAIEYLADEGYSQTQITELEPMHPPQREWECEIYRDDEDIPILNRNGFTPTEAIVACARAVRSKG